MTPAEENLHTIANQHLQQAPVPLNAPTKQAMNPGRYETVIEGPTLRDQFAMAALTGIIAAPTTSEDASMQVMAEDAYRFADKMLAERAKK